MGGDRNTVHIVTRDGVDSWPVMTKDEVATALVARIAETMKDPTP
jgi:phosphopantothenoylcysteine decarboxylase/phosphopantothenate--cysteine ligase